MAIYIPKGHTLVVKTDKRGNKQTEIKKTKSPTKWKTGDKHGPTTKEAKALQKSSSRKPRRTYSEAETKTQYRDINSMTPDEARAKGYKYSGAVGYYKISKEEQDYKEEKERFGTRVPVTPKLKVERKTRGSLSPQQAKDGGWERLGSTGEYERIPATKENIDKQRQYLRDLNRYYDDTRREEVRKPSGINSGQTYQIDGRNISRKEYLKILDTEHKNIKSIQRLAPKKVPESTKKQIRINLNQETVSFEPERHPNKSTSIDIEDLETTKLKHQTWTKDDEEQRKKSKEVYDAYSPNQKRIAQAKTILSIHGAEYVGAVLGGTDISKNIMSPRDALADSVTQNRKINARDKRIKIIDSGIKSLEKKEQQTGNSYTKEINTLKSEKQQLQKKTRDVYWDNAWKNPVVEFEKFEITTSALGKVGGVMGAALRSPIVAAAGGVMGVNEVLNIKDQYKAGNQLSAFERSIPFAGVLAGGAAAGAKGLTKEIKIKSVSSVKPERINLVGSAKKVGTIKSRQRVVTQEKTTLDKIFKLQGKTKITDLDVTADAIFKGSRFDLKVDIRSMAKGYNLKGSKHPKFNKDVLMRGKVKTTGKPKVETISDLLKDSPFMQQRQTITKIRGKTKTTTKTTPIKDTDADLQTITQNMNLFRSGKTSKHQTLAEIFTNSRKTTTKHYTNTKKGKPVYEKSDITEELAHISKSMDSTLREQTSVGKTTKTTQKYHQDNMYQPTKIQRQVSSQKSVLYQEEIIPYKAHKVSALRQLKNQLRPMPKQVLRQPDINKLVPNVKMPTIQRKAIKAPRSRSAKTRTVQTHRTVQQPASQGQMIQSVNKEISRVTGQNYLKYLKQNHAVNTANLGRIQMKSLSMARAITQQPQNQNQKRNVRIRNSILPTMKQPQINQLKLINNLMLANSPAQKSISVPKTKQPSKTKQKAIEVVVPSDFVNMPVIKMFPTSIMIRQPVKRVARLPGTKRNFRISKTKPKKGMDTELNIIERKMKSILDVI